MWSVASLEKTKVNSVYLGGRVTLGLAFLAAIASSVVVMSLVMRGNLVGINWEPQHMIW